MSGTTRIRDDSPARCAGSGGDTSSRQRRLIRNFTLWGWVIRPSPEDIDAFLREVRLPTERDMRECFPDAAMWCERVLRMKKALIAVKV